MPLEISRHGIRGDLAGDIALLENLLADFRRVEDNDLPTREEIAGAPFLDDYVIDTREMPCLLGLVTGHPRIGPGPVTTSQIWMFAGELGWARTLSRLYRLGRPYDGRLL